MSQIIILLGIVLFSMTIHEAMHAYVGYWLGDDTAKREGRLSLNPLTHIDPFMTLLLPILLLLSGGPIFGGAKPVPFNPNRVRYGEFGAMLVGIAGPITNLVIAFITFGLLVFSKNDFVNSILLLAIKVNIGFFVFNMIPIPPLDGSRALYYLAPEPIRHIMESLEHYGIIIVLAIVILFGEFLSSYMLAAINFFVTIFAAIFGVVL